LDAIYESNKISLVNSAGPADFLGRMSTRWNSRIAFSPVLPFYLVDSGRVVWCIYKYL